MCDVEFAFWSCEWTNEKILCFVLSQFPFDSYTAKKGIWGKYSKVWPRQRIENENEEKTSISFIL